MVISSVSLADCSILVRIPLNTALVAVLDTVLESLPPHHAASTLIEPWGTAVDSIVHRMFGAAAMQYMAGIGDEQGLRAFADDATLD